MSSQHYDSELKKPTPRRFFSRTTTTDDTSWIDSREILTSSPVQNAPPTTHKDLRKVLPFASSSSSSFRSASPDSFSVADPNDRHARERWDSVRKHVLVAAGQTVSSPTGSRSGTPTPGPGPNTNSPYYHYQQPSSASSTTSFPQRPPSRSQTPKPGSRLAARLGFKHVVEHARETAVDENRRLADDIFRACWAMRGSGDSFNSGRTKHGDTLNTMFTGAQSPYGGGYNPSSTSTFNVSASLASASTSAYNLINSTSHIPLHTQHPTPSIKHLHQVLWQASGSTSSSLRSVYLPHETLVLSMLLTPFLSGSIGTNDPATAGRLEEERWLAIDAFEVMVKTWPPANEMASAERCLWCTKASTPLSASPLRTRILSSLWSLTNPNENTHVVLSPDTIHSIASGIFLLFPLLSPLPPQPQPHREETSSDVSILKEVLSHLSTGVLDEEACEDEYDSVKWNAKADDADVVRRTMLSEALARCLMVCSTEGRESARMVGWFIGQAFDDYWVKIGERPTPLQVVMSVRRVIGWCSGVTSFLSQQHQQYHSPPPPQDAEHNSTSSSSSTIAITQRIIRLLEDVIIPEIHTLSASSSLQSTEAKVKEARKNATRVVLEILCCTSSVSASLGAGSGIMPLASVDPVTWAVELIDRWYTNGNEAGWKGSFEDMFKYFVTTAEWKVVVDRLMSFFTRMNTSVTSAAGVGVRKMVVGVAFTCLTDRLIQDPPPAYLLTSSIASANTPGHEHTRTHSNQSSYSQYSPSHSRSSSYTLSPSSPPTASLTALLKLISETHPQTFFKPLFSLATSSPSSSSSTQNSSGGGTSVIMLASTLSVVHALSAIVRDWWVRDAEMVCVALMSDVGASSSAKGKGKARDTGPGMGTEGGTVRLGQMIALLEVVAKLRALRRLRDAKTGGGSVSEVITNALGSDAARVNLSKFVVGLELRLSILIEAKEKTHSLPPTQRLLFLLLFRELRLLTRSLKPTSWVSNIITRWFEEYLQDEDGQSEEIEERLKEMKEVYEFAKGVVGNTNKRRTVVMMPTTTSASNDKRSAEEESVNVTDTLNNSIKLLSSLARGGLIPRMVKLLVTVSAMLSASDWSRVAPLVWYRGLLFDPINDVDRSEVVLGEGKKQKALVPLVCFLIMQCAEKNSLDFRAMVEVDMRSSDDLTRLESVQKLSLLINWRFQLMSDSHNILVDRTHRPFKLARAPLPFVPTDIGSPNYVHDEDDTFFPHANMSYKGTSSTSNSTVKPQKGNMTKDIIPVELRRQLVEIGWADDEVQGDEKEMWTRTPVSLLPVNQVEKLDLQRSESQHPHHGSHSPTAPALSSPAASSGGQLAPLLTGPSVSGKVDGGEGELLRRNSSSGGPTYAKRRAVFVPPLSLVFRVLATMVFDTNFAVASAARDALLDLMRNDPGLLLRPILDLFCDEQQEDDTQKDIPEAVNILTALIHTRHMIPPPMAHALFNNLAGFLKYALRQADPAAAAKHGGGAGGPSAGETLTSFALTVPIMAKLAMYVGDLTIREIRRSKMEHFLIPYGTLWFDHVGVPSGPMFPRGLGLDVESEGLGREWRRGWNPFEPENTRQTGPKTVIVGLDSRLVNVMMIRIAQNMMFVHMLKKSAQDVVLVRKTMPKFVVPRLDGSEREEDGRTLELSDFVPFVSKSEGHSSSDGYAQKTLNVLSLALARSYVTLVAQVFRCMSRNSNDREEMAGFVTGLNRILLVHGDDVGIIGHVLIAFMVASARFRRLFTSGGGYALFMPALAKVYAEAHQRADIKLAIEYAVYRFYALHREAFLFQSLDAIAHIAALPETDAVQYAARVYDLFYSLRSGVAPTNLDPAGIHGMNQSQEKEALLFNAAEDKPQTFLAAIRRGEAQTNGQIFFEVPDAYESSRLRLEDFVKLFLTIIAHDPSILRAQHFMRMFRFLAPHLYNASSQARNVLQEGLVALSEILPKVLAKSKSAEAGNAVRVGETDTTLVGSIAGQEAPEKTKNMSNPNVMRMDFLLTLVAVGQAGCHIPPQMAKQAIETARLILKDNPPEMLQPLSTFFADLTKLILLRGDLSKPKYVIPFIQEISPFMRAYTTTFDFASILETVTQLCSIPPYTHDPVFAKLVGHEICVSGLEACELITPETEASKPRFRPALVSLLAEAVFLRGSDVVGELEKRKPTYHFLAKVILPLTLTLRTSNQLASERGKSESWHRPALTRSWVRLIFYAMTACQRSFRAAENLPLSRSKSREKRRGEEKQWQAHLPTFTTALQIIKVIVVRAEMEISSTLPDLWQRLAGFFRSALMDGNANFALHGSVSREASPMPSPSPSPRGSAQMDRTRHTSFFFDLPGQSTMDASSIPPSSPPRVIDYALWSILEFLCAYRSPLRLQLRLFMVEKIVALDQELKHRERRQSPFASPNSTPTSRRISTSVFAKPRRSGMFPSPDSSPRASRSPSMTNELSIPSINLGPGMNRATSLEIPTSNSGGELRIPGYQYISPTVSPSTPRRGSAAYLQVEAQGPRIIHLGPTSPSALIPPSPLSPSGGGSMGVSNIRLMGQSTKIKSSTLVKATYRRIRAVQTFMGYDALLPLPSGNVGLGISGLGMETDEVSFVTWTKRTALEAILNEMKQLEEEFEETINIESIEDDNLTERVSVSPTNHSQPAV
ncbi:hypothetical protein D9756_003121 [Leucocoprinus leucothites]|uniref:Protein UNC80 C-terminal domain-containing protein n=1 Tax=Leucocoprinus leucothites TaxID=201217 RepID=A0A8H5G753_9AGAR|nr:hypothetical protein D9756_003121 [Leucoagaricus leucothites]